MPFYIPLSRNDRLKIALFSVFFRKNVPVKKTKFYNDQVEYFNSAKAIDMLVKDSPWSKVRDVAISTTCSGCVFLLLKLFVWI